MPPRITQEKKWGMYMSDCESRLYDWLFISFSINARIIGAGKPNIML